jgi:endonuclease I
MRRNVFFSTTQMPFFSAVFCLFFVFNTLNAHTQGTQPVFPGLFGKELLDSVGSHFRPDTVLPYNVARDTLYAKILAIDDDTLRCIYTGHRLYLDPMADPTQYVYLNGNVNGMNAEHAYPQSKGTSTGNARSDMHHLYPVRIAVNQVRGSVPFGDIPDNLTERWYVGTQSQISIPAQNKDAYSEWRSAMFEPRESVKGDIARSVFYIYTIYRAQANAADPAFFDLQRATLCQWHKNDPADAAEIKKTWRIAAYQDGQPNPFVLDCTLAHRCWCQDVPPACASATNDPNMPQERLRLRATPLPATGAAQIKAELPISGALTGRLMDINQREVLLFENRTVFAGAFEHTLALDNVPTGTYFLQVTVRDERQEIREVVKIIKGD